MKKIVSVIVTLIFMIVALFPIGSVNFGFTEKLQVMAALTAEQKFNKTAVFDVIDEVTHEDPGDWSVTYGNGINSGSELNSRIEIGGAEPIVFRSKYVPTADSPNEIIVSDSNINGFDSYAEGMLEGADVRVYRPVNGKIELVRTDVVDKFNCSGTFDVLKKIVSGNKAYVKFGSYDPPGAANYYSVKAVDSNGNESGYSNWVQAINTAQPPGAPTSSPGTNVFLTNTPIPAVAASPLPPINLTRSISASKEVTLTWENSLSPNVVGFKVYKSYYPPENQKGFHIFLKNYLPENPLKINDMIFVHKKFYSWSRIKYLSPRVYVAKLGVDKRTVAPFFPDESPNRTYSLVPHGSTPPEFTDKGETCAKIELLDSTAVFDSKLTGYSGVSPTGDDWYHIMEPGKTYVMEAWIKKEGSNPLSATFSFSGFYQTKISPKTFSVTDSWVKYKYEFVVPPDINNSKTVSQYLLIVNGPATFYIDNYRLYCKDSEFADWMPREKQLLKDSGFKILRNHTFIKSAEFNFDMDMLLNPPGAMNGTAGGGSTLYNQFKLCKDTNTLPWLQVEMYMSEKEWQDLVEYICAPYDPLIDTPSSKPSAYKRYISGQAAPWSDVFSKIYFEISNETWNPMFAPWTFPATTDSVTGAQYNTGNTYGLFQEYVLDIMAKSPYWMGMKDKIFPIIGGWGVNNYEMSAALKSPNSKALLRAGYNGGWDEGTILDANDGGYFFTAMVGPQKTEPVAKAQLQLRNSLGLTQPLGTYEAGPGYSLPGTAGTPEEQASVEKNNDMQKSLVGGVSTIDSFLIRAAYYEFDIQNFFTFHGNRNYWSSHAWTSTSNPRFGGQIYPSFNALTLYTKYARGDFLKVNQPDGPTVDIPAIGTRSAAYDSSLVASYATRKGNDVNVFVLNRKIDNYPFTSNAGYSKAELNLPFNNCESVTLRKMEGKWDGTKFDPRISNIDANNIDIQTINVPIENFNQHFVIDDKTGAQPQGLVPCGIYLYTFHNVSKSAPEAPEITAINYTNMGPRFANRLTWSASQTSAFYQIYAAPNSGAGKPALSDFSLIGSTKADCLEFNDLTSNPNVDYYYFVRGVNAIGYYADSQIYFAPKAGSGSIVPNGTTAPMGTPVVTPSPEPTPIPPMLFAYEGFAYPTGNLSGLSGGENWNGPWVVSNPDATPGNQVSDILPLDNKGIAFSGNYLSGLTNNIYAGRNMMATSGAFTDMRKYLNSSYNFGKAGTTIWLSSLMRFDNGTPKGYIALHGGTGNPYSRMGNDPTTHFISIGCEGNSSKKADGKFYWTITSDGTYYLSDKSITLGETAFIAVRIDFTEVGGKISLYVNPSPLTDPSSMAPNLQYEITDRAYNLSTVAFNRALSNQLSIDEIRIGNLYEAVAPIYYEPGATPVPTATPIPTPFPTVRPAPWEMATPTPSPTPVPTASPTSSAVAVPTPSATPSPTASAVPTPDVTKPVISIKPYSKSWTNKDLTVYASTNEGIINSKSHKFSANGSFAFKATDKSGNYSIKKVTVTCIDKSSPKISVKTAKGKTVAKNSTVKGTVKLTVTEKNLYSKGIQLNGKNIKWPSSNTLKVRGKYIITIKDKAKNISVFKLQIS